MALTSPSQIRRLRRNLVISAFWASCFASVLALYLKAPSSTFAFRHRQVASTFLRYIKSDAHVATCGNPLLPRRIAGSHASPRDFPWSSYQCRTLRLTVDDYSVEICEHLNLCNAFSIFVKPHDTSVCGPVPEDFPLSTDPRLNTIALETLGPMEFRLSVEGTELFSTSAFVYDRDSCSYRYDLALQNNGPALLQVWHLFEDYGSFDEENEVPGTQLRRPVLEVPYRLAPCDSQCSQHYAVPPIPANRPYSTEAEVPGSFAEVLPIPGAEHDQKIGSSETSTLSIQTKGSSSLPSCDGRSRTTYHGAYLPLPPWAQQADIYPDNATTRYMPETHSGHYAFQPTGCVWRHPGVRMARHDSCWTQKDGEHADGLRRVLFKGDSHGRVVFDALMHRLLGHYDYVTRSEKSGDKGAVVGNVMFNFTWDPRLGSVLPPCETLSTLSGIVISVAAHPAVNMRLKDFIIPHAAILRQAAACPGPLPPLIYLLGPPHPPRDDPSFVNSNDRRTNHRMRIFNDAIASVVLNETNKWSAVDQQELLDPFDFFPLRTDKAHFLETDGLEAVLDEVMGKLQLCGSHEMWVAEPVVPPPHQD